jgi:hypothetical protein
MKASIGLLLILSLGEALRAQAWQIERSKNAITDDAITVATIAVKSELYKKTHVLRLTLFERSTGEAPKISISIGTPEHTPLESEARKASDLGFKDLWFRRDQAQPKRCLWVGGTPETNRGEIIFTTKEDFGEAIDLVVEWAKLELYRARENPDFRQNKGRLIEAKALRPFFNHAILMVTELLAAEKQLAFTSLIDPDDSCVFPLGAKFAPLRPQMLAALRQWETTQKNLLIEIEAAEQKRKAELRRAELEKKQLQAVRARSEAANEFKELLIQKSLESISRLPLPPAGFSANCTVELPRGKGPSISSAFTPEVPEAIRDAFTSAISSLPVAPEALVGLSLECTITFENRELGIKIVETKAQPAAIRDGQSAIRPSSRFGEIDKPAIQIELPKLDFSR